MARRKTWLRGAVVMLAALAVAACSTGPAPGAASKPATAPGSQPPAASAPAPASKPGAAAPTAAPPIKMVANYSARGSGQSGLWYAFEGGYNREQGVDVELTSIAATSAVVQAMLANDVQVGG